MSIAGRLVVAGQGGGSYVPPPQPVAYAAMPGQAMSGPVTQVPGYTMAAYAPQQAVPSYVAAPAMPSHGGVLAAQPPAGPPAGPPAPPMKLTDGLPDPASIDRQKRQYDQQLSQELDQGTKALEAQRQQQKEIMFKQADAQKKQFLLHMDQQRQQQEFSLDERMNQAIIALRQSALEQKAQLESQASNLVLDFKQKRAQEEFAQQQYEIQRQLYDAHQKFHRDMTGVVQQAASAHMPGPQAAPCPMHHAPVPGASGPLPHMPTHGCPGGCAGGSYVPPPTMAPGMPQMQQTPSYTPPPAYAVAPTQMGGYQGMPEGYQGVAPATTYAAYGAPPTYCAQPATQMQGPVY